MSDFREVINPYFSLDHLRHLDPDNNVELAKILMGTYIVNATGREVGLDLATSYGDEEVIKNIAHDNIRTISGFFQQHYVKAHALGSDALPVDKYTTIHPEGVQIRKATGYINIPEIDTSQYIVPVDNTSVLRLFSARPKPNRQPEKVWDVHMVGEDFEPLVDIQVKYALAPAVKFGKWVAKKVRES